MAILRSVWRPSTADLESLRHTWQWPDSPFSACRALALTVSPEMADSQDYDPSFEPCGLTPVGRGNAYHTALPPKDFVVGSGVGLFAILKFLKSRRIWKHENVQAGQVRGS